MNAAALPLRVCLYMCACRVEMVLRLFALGVWRGPHTYWANGYNRLDIAIIASSW